MKEAALGGLELAPIQQANGPPSGPLDFRKRADQGGLADARNSVDMNHARPALVHHLVQQAQFSISSEETAGCGFPLYWVSRHNGQAEGRN
jgi:hypothetical protein